MTEAEVIDILNSINEDFFQPDNPNEFDDVNKAFEVAIKALEKQIEINNMVLIQSHRKCVLGRDEMYSHSTLQSMSKLELITLLNVAQNNYSVLLETLDGRVKYYEKELAAMSDEIKFEE